MELVIDATPLAGSAAESGSGIDWLNVISALVAVAVSAFGGTFLGHYLTGRREREERKTQFRTEALNAMAQLLSVESFGGPQAPFDELFRLAARTADSRVQDLAQALKDYHDEVRKIMDRNPREYVLKGSSANDVFKAQSALRNEQRDALQAYIESRLKEVYE